MTSAGYTNLLSSPSLSGTMRESPLYQTLGVGFTNRVFLIGHADGLQLNDPYQVASVQEAVNLLGADSACPLLRALLEAYYSGARDIFLVATAPMSEYVPDLADRTTVNFASPGAAPVTDGLTFWERYQARLAVTYQLLADWDLPQILVPVEASFINTGGVDFATSLAEHCDVAFTTTGVIRLGLLGNRGKLDAAAVAEVLADDRLGGNLGMAGRYLMLLLGEGLLNIKELPTAYAAGLGPTVAGELSGLRLDRGLTYYRLQNVISPTHGDLSAATLKAVSDRGANVLVRTMAGQRGTPFQTVLATDNTLALAGSDYWSLTQMRLVANALDQLRAIGRAYIGSIDLAQFKSEVHAYLLHLLSSQAVRGYEVNIDVDKFDRSRVSVEVLLRPFYGVREITFVASVGPTGGRI